MDERERGPVQQHSFLVHQGVIVDDVQSGLHHLQRASLHHIPVNPSDIHQFSESPPILTQWAELTVPIMTENYLYLQFQSVCECV